MADAVRTDLTFTLRTLGTQPIAHSVSGFLRRISIKQKLWAMAGLAGVIFLVLAAATIVQLQNAQDRAAEAAAKAEMVDDITGLAQNWDAATRDAYFYIVEAGSGQLKDTASYDGVMDDVADAVDLAAELGVDLAGTDHADEIDEMADTLDAWVTSFEEQHQLIQAGKVDAAAKQLLTVQRPMIGSMDDMMGVQADRITAEEAAAKEASDDALSSAKRVLILVSAIGLVLLVGLAFLIIRSISGPLDRIVGGLKAIASGDRSQKVDYDRPDEIGAIVTAMDTVVEFLDKADADAAEAERERIARDEQERDACAGRSRSGSQTSRPRSCSGPWTSRPSACSAPPSSRPRPHASPPRRSPAGSRPRQRVPPRRPPRRRRAPARSPCCWSTSRRSPTVT
jgi:CHASE3 domain sensor protein